MLALIDDDAIELRTRHAQNKQLMRFEASRSHRFVDYYVKYTMQFGTLHLVNPMHKRSYREVYDLDIQSAFLIVGISLYKILKMLLFKKESETDTEIVTSKTQSIDELRDSLKKKGKLTEKTKKKLAAQEKKLQE